MSPMWWKPFTVVLQQALLTSVAAFSCSSFSLTKQGLCRGSGVVPVGRDGHFGEEGGGRGGGGLYTSTTR